MTVLSYTGNLNTNNAFEKLETLANITLDENTKYTIQIQNIADFKIGNAEFTIKNDIFTFKQGEDDVYIRTSSLGAKITILENT